MGIGVNIKDITAADQSKISETVVACNVHRLFLYHTQSGPFQTLVSESDFDMFPPSKADTLSFQFGVSVTRLGSNIIQCIEQVLKSCNPEALLLEVGDISSTSIKELRTALSTKKHKLQVLKLKALKVFSPLEKFNSEVLFPLMREVSDEIIVEGWELDERNIEILQLHMNESHLASLRIIVKDENIHQEIRTTAADRIQDGSEFGSQTSTLVNQTLETIDGLLNKAKYHHAKIKKDVIPFMRNEVEKLGTSEEGRMGDVKATCMQKIAQAHFLTGCFEDALAAAKEGLSGEQLHAKIMAGLFIMAGDSSCKLGNFSEAESFYCQAHSLIRGIGSKEENESLFQKITGCIDLTNRIKNSNDSVTKILGPKGGKIVTEELTITFPEDALDELIPFNSTLDFGGEDIPSNHIPIAPRLKLYPRMNLNKPATVRVKTWCSVKKADTKAAIYYKESKAADWKWVGTTEIGSEREIVFQIHKFCKYAVVMESEVDFHMKSWLFVSHDQLRLWNQIFADSKLITESVQKEMEAYGLIPSYRPVDFITAKDDTFRIQLRPENEERPPCRIEPAEQQVQITADVLRKSMVDSEDLDFFAKECSGIDIFLNHKVSQLRGRQVVKEQSKQVVLGRRSHGRGDVQLHGNFRIGQIGS